jgi:hypothetical protein
LIPEQSEAKRVAPILHGLHPVWRLVVTRPGKTPRARPRADENRSFGGKNCARDAERGSARQGRWRLVCWLCPDWASEMIRAWSTVNGGDGVWRDLGRSVCATAARSVTVVTPRKSGFN